MESRHPSALLQMMMTTTTTTRYRPLELRSALARQWTMTTTIDNHVDNISTISIKNCGLMGHAERSIASRLPVPSRRARVTASSSASSCMAQAVPK